MQLTRLRNQAISLLGASDLSRKRVTSIVGRSAGRKRHCEAVLTEAIDGAESRELKRTLEMIRWAQAVEGSASFPQWFPAAHHITTVVGRTRSAEALRSYLEQQTNAAEFLWRQLFALEAKEDISELQEFVREDLGRRLQRTPPADASGVIRASPPELSTLQRVVEALSEAGIRPFLVSGTLLGLVRNGSLLAHDYDIDLGVLPNEGDAEAVGVALKQAGFDVSVDSLKVVANDADGIVDVFIHYERDGLLWHGTEIHEWWNSPFGLEASDLGGVGVWIPDNADTYLTENYGDWSRPVAFYNFSFDTPNRVYRTTPQALLYLHKRFVRALEYGDRWSAESSARELKRVFGVDVTASFNPTPLLEEE